MNYYYSKNHNLVSLNLFFLMLGPPLINSILGINSLAPGLLVFSYMLLLLNISFGAKILKKEGVTLIIIFLVLLISALINYIFYNDIKPLFSISWVGCLLWCASFASIIQSSKIIELKRAFRDISIILVAVGWINIAFIINGNGGDNFLFFGEASHLALATGIISMPNALIGSKKLMILLFFSFLMFGFIFPSLTFLVFAIIFAFFCFIRIIKIPSFSYILFLPIILITSLTYLINLSDYFSERLIIFESRNLSALVILQGWELAKVNFINTYGFGLGYQMLGGQSTNLPDISYYIASVKPDNSFSSISSGGFLAAKIIAELGVLGLFLITFYVLISLKFISSLGVKIHSFKSNKLYTPHPSLFKNVLAGSIMIGFAVEMFLRGTGYFSPTLLLFLAIIFFNMRNR